MTPISKKDKELHDMDKGKQPTIWGKHNFNLLTEEAFRRTEEKERARVVGEILDHPDGCEEGNINYS